MLNSPRDLSPLHLICSNPLTIFMAVHWPYSGVSLPLIVEGSDLDTGMCYQDWQENHHLPRSGGDASWNEALDCFLHSFLQWPRVVLPPVQGFVFTIVELHEFPVCPLFQLAEYFRTALPTGWGYTLTVEVFNDNEQYCPLYWSLGYPTNDWPQLGLMSLIADLWIWQFS